MKFQENISLKDFTSYKIGGEAKYFFKANTKEELATAVGEAKRMKLPVFILGGGSNILVSDKGFKGIVIKINILDVLVKSQEISAGAGIVLGELSLMAAEKGLSGLEWAVGIPRATLGGAIFGHAQAFDSKISDIVASVEALDLKTFKTKNFTKKQCAFSLKSSIFKKNKNLTVISALLHLNKKDPLEIKDEMKRNLEYRLSRHPLEFPSAGSTFVNPENKIKNKNLFKKFPELEDFNKSGAIPAGYLIAKTGLSGRQAGGAKISEKHCNFIINAGSAKAEDVLALIKLARQKVKKTFGIDLELEVQLVGFQKI